MTANPMKLRHCAHPGCTEEGTYRWEGQDYFCIPHAAEQIGQPCAHPNCKEPGLSPVEDGKWLCHAHISERALAVLRDERVARAIKEEDEYEKNGGRLN
jgi:hypothetical protein